MSSYSGKVFRRAGSPMRSAAAVFGIAGVAVAAAGVMTGWFEAEAPDVGMLTAVHAQAPEDVDIVELAAGETLGRVLTAADFSAREQHAFLLAFRERANPNRLRPGTEITFRWFRGNRNRELRGVDVVVSPDEMVRLDRTAFGWDSEVVATPVWTDTIASAGEITSDLWSALVLNPDLSDVPRQDRFAIIDHLDRVFQWQVDFSRQIHTGDRYRVVFERQVRPDGTMREGRIIGAELVNRGESLHAIWFDVEGNGEGGFYELDGESVRRAFLTKPLEFRRISSRFNPNRLHPILEERRPHIGVDYAADTGTPVYATGDGVVTVRGRQGGYGNLVEIRHANGFMTRYAHLNGFASSLRAGQRVNQGQTIGYVGMTGLATGPHLHYEMHRNGTPIDPLSIDIPAGEPIPDDRRDRWEEGRDEVLALLRTTRYPERLQLADFGGGEGRAGDLQ